MRRLKYIGVVAFVAVGLLAACQPINTGAVQKKDRRQAAQQLGTFQTNQPTPNFDYSQLRQTLEEIETAQAHSTQTTSFFYELGVIDPKYTCPSIGFPIPSTFQLSNPLQKVVNSDAVIGQLEPTGVYTGNSDATYVLCVNAQGQPYVKYWEGHVSSFTGPAKYNYDNHQEELVGPPSFTFTKKDK